MENTIVNACIGSTMLGYEDHGIMSFFLYLDFDGYHQGFGGYALDNYSDVMKQRIPTAFGMGVISEILKVVGVEKWEDLPGKYIRVVSSRTGIDKIGNITKDKWFSISEYLKASNVKEGE